MAKNKAKSKKMMRMPKTKKTVKTKKNRKTLARQPVSPLSDRVLLRPLSGEELGTKSPSGIIIPETISKEKPEQGVVIAVGPGKWDEDGNYIPMSVKPGDRVMFSKYGYDEVKVSGVEYYIVS